MRTSWTGHTSNIPRYWFKTSTLREHKLYIWHKNISTLLRQLHCNNFISLLPIWHGNKDKFHESVIKYLVSECRCGWCPELISEGRVACTDFVWPCATSDISYNVLCSQHKSQRTSWVHETMNSAEKIIKIEKLWPPLTSTANEQDED